MPRHPGRRPSLQHEPAESSAAAADGEFDSEAMIARTYERMHALARGRLRRETDAGVLQTTALVHEACLRLLQESRGSWTMNQFLGAAAEAMRRILVEKVRSERRQKRGGGRRPVPLSVVGEPPDLPAPLQIDLLALDEALEVLRQEDGRMYQVVMLRFFAGLELAQVAEVLGVSSRTVDREWRCARLWLLERWSEAAKGEHQA
jgi:RNA polymerase sigma factor (TIGR02999 family)